MQQYIVKVLDAFFVTHDARCFRVEQPVGYIFTPGQAAEIAINKTGWKEERRPFTFTNLPDDDHLEFTIKTYPAHKGVTNELLQVKKNDEFILHEVFGAIAYKGEGVFIAGGAGITPFISIFRYLRSKNEIGNNKLIFANKTKADIILEPEFTNLLGKNFINILSDENIDGYARGMITEDFLKANITNLNVKFYVCGPPPMMEAVKKLLANLGVEKKSIIEEAV